MPSPDPTRADAEADDPAAALALPAAPRHEALRRHAALLAGVAGYVDALGYFDLGRVFTANMTGNTVLLFAAGARGDWVLAGVYAATLAAFVGGALAAATLRRWLGRPFVGLLLIAIALVVLGLVQPPRVPALAALAFTMGIQAATVTRFRGTRVQTVVLTGTLVGLAEIAVARAWRGGATAGDATDAAPRSLATPVLVWTAYGAGAAAAVVAMDRVLVPLAVPAVVLALTALDLVRRSSRRRARRDARRARVDDRGAR